MFIVKQNHIIISTDETCNAILTSLLSYRFAKIEILYKQYFSGLYSYGAGKNIRMTELLKH